MNQANLTLSFWYLTLDEIETINRKSWEFTLRLRYEVSFLLGLKSSKKCIFLENTAKLLQILLKKCIGRRYRKFPDLLIFEIGKWNSPFWIALSNCRNIQKKFFEKVDYRGRYSSIFEMGTALGKRDVATSILKPHPCHPHYFGTKTWWSHPENLSLIALLVPKIFSVLRKKTLLKCQISASFRKKLEKNTKGGWNLDFQNCLFPQNAKYLWNQ